MTQKEIIQSIKTCEVIINDKIRLKKFYQDKIKDAKVWIKRSDDTLRKEKTRLAELKSKLK